MSGVEMEKDVPEKIPARPSGLDKPANKLLWNWHPGARCPLHGRHTEIFQDNPGKRLLRPLAMNSTAMAARSRPMMRVKTLMPVALM